MAGKVKGTAYRNRLLRLVSPTIRVEDRFVDDAELYSLIAASHLVLFTYQEESVLSSGALMDSIAAGATVAGPDTGAFRDLGRLGLVITYSGPGDLIEKIDEILDHRLTVDPGKLNAFIEENTWEKFSARLADYLYSEKS